MINEVLEKIGFTKKEAVVYAALVAAGKATPAELAKTTGINRATVYGLAKALIKRGVVYEDITGRPRNLTPNPLPDLRRLTSSAKREVEEKDKLIATAIDELSNISANTRYTVPKIRFVEQEQLRDFLFKETTGWYESLEKSGEAWWGFQDHRLVEEYQDWIDYSWKKYPEQTVKLLSNDSRVEAAALQRYPKNREIRFWSMSQNFTATTWIVGDYTILLSTRGTSDYLVEIHDAVFAHNLREVFKGIWHTLPKL